MTETVDLLIEGKRIVICAGSGGVGKTTTAAAIATGLASRGMRVAVLTIDPARRLAQSLGLEELDNEARRVAPERFAGTGIEMRGELWAMMLDAKRTFDELVERYAPGPAARDRLLGNRIYAEISTAVSGSQEYMAMEKLNELDAEARYDALVLDTPPTRSALDFLDAPSRLSRFIDSRALGALIRPGGRLLGRGSSVLFHALKRITGVDVMEDISEFFAAFADMAQGFRDRAAQVDALLSGPATAFLVVTSPQPHAIDEAIFFRRRLEERRLPFAGVVLNRMHVRPGGFDRSVARAELAELLGVELGGKVARSLEEVSARANRDRRSAGRLERAMGGAPVVSVPDLDDDVHDIAGLAAMNEFLFGERTAGAQAG
ncbi:MAG TPA: ArsA-related P-loop ATPase [Thermoleophilaceae bacterium]|nr:ArsA-related P-loop ATPase [Thermoleophilaceae bacterium]